MVLGVITFCSVHQVKDKTLKQTKIHEKGVFMDSVKIKHIYYSIFLT